MVRFLSLFPFFFLSFYSFFLSVPLSVCLSLLSLFASFVCLTSFFLVTPYSIQDQLTIASIISWFITHPHIYPPPPLSSSSSSSSSSSLSLSLPPSWLSSTQCVTNKAYNHNRDNHYHLHGHHHHHQNYDGLQKVTFRGLVGVILCQSKFQHLHNTFDIFQIVTSSYYYNKEIFSDNDLVTLAV